jgi:phosphate transport system permease protein
MSVINREGLISLSPEYPVEAQPIIARKRILPERIAIRRYLSIAVGWFLGFLATSIFVMLPLLIVGIFARAAPLFAEVSLDNLTGLDWNPARGMFGLTPFVVGSLWVTALAMLLSVPISLFSAVYLSEYVRDSHRKWIRPLVELLAGVPSVVYGLWGLLVIVPLVRSFASAIQAEQTTGFGILSASLVLALMVTPFMIALMDELMQATPHGTRDAAFALGATRWEVVRDVLFKYSRRGLVAAIGLGFARALGETLAVMMLVGNVAKLPGNPLDAAYPLPALIALNFGEMMSVPLYDAALMTAALLLLILVLMFNLGSRAIIQRMTRYEA